METQERPSRLVPVLVTGGAGYIGSHTSLLLLERGYDVIVVDSLDNSQLESLERIQRLTQKKVTFYQGHIQNESFLRSIFQKHKIEAVIHFAGLKAVNESIANSLLYYQSNVEGTITLLRVMESFQVTNLIFSSSATVYGQKAEPPVREDAVPLDPSTPYGRTKYFIEQILQDVYISQKERKPAPKIVLLRYFNPIGAHSSGLLGEDPRGVPTNLLPYVTQVAVGKLPHVNIFGCDYPTADGSGVRDFIHVVDLAEGHLAALQKILNTETAYLDIFNLGTGQGYSVLEVIKTMGEVSGKEIPYIIQERREGDIGISYADVSKVARELGWKAQFGLRRMCEDAWRWQKMNPDGYGPITKGQTKGSCSRCPCCSCDCSECNPVIRTQ